MQFREGYPSNEQARSLDRTIKRTNPRRSMAGEKTTDYRTRYGLFYDSCAWAIDAQDIALMLSPHEFDVNRAGEPKETVGSTEAKPTVGVRKSRVALWDEVVCGRGIVERQRVPT